MQFDSSRQTAASATTAPDVSAVMRDVLIALLPGTLVYAWLFGWGVISNVLLAMAFAVVFEALALRLRNRSVRVGLADYSVLVTAWLFALAVPPMASWWLIMVGIGFAVLLAKHVYGGLGYNPFNPAMVGYVVLLISFPREMTQWLTPLSLTDSVIGFAATINVVFTGTLPDALSWDAITRATPLDRIKTGLGQNFSIDEISRAPIFGYMAGTAWEWVSCGWLAGGIWLLYKRHITWHIPFGLLVSVALFATVFSIADTERYASPIFHLLSGATILGAIFIATDPVTAPSSNRGRLVFALLIGTLTYLIRTWGGYPDAIAFAVLLGNMCAPTIDYYCRPRPYGHRN